MNAGQIVASVLLLLGSALALVAGIGLVRLPDVFARMHAATKPATLGLLLVCVGAAIADADAAPTSPSSRWWSRCSSSPPRSGPTWSDGPRTGRATRWTRRPSRTTSASRVRRRSPSSAALRAVDRLLDGSIETPWVMPSGSADHDW